MTIIITKVPRRGHAGLAVYESGSTNHISVFFLLLWEIFTSRIPSGIFVDWWRSQSRGRAPTLPLPCEVCILSKMSQSRRSVFLVWPPSCPDASKQMLRVGVKAVFVLQPKAWHPQMDAPDIIGNRTRNLCYVNRSRCPLGYKPYEHRKIESS